jgi:hypothetical protein
MVWIVLLMLFSTVALIFTFATNRDATIIGYVSYVLSAFTMTVLVINTLEMIPQIQSFIHSSEPSNRVKSIILSNKYSSQYLTDLPFRSKISLYVSLSINLLYAVVKLIAGIYYASFWYGADAIFYIVLSIARALLMRYMRTDENNLAAEYRVYRSCGVVLFALSAALTGVVYLVVNQNMGYTYPGLLIYMVATFAFVNITIAIINVVKHHKLNNPVQRAAKALSLAKALVMMFALQSAMFASFGGESLVLERVANIVFGSFVCLSIIAMAVMMVVEANSKIKNPYINNSETKSKQNSNIQQLCLDR